MSRHYFWQIVNFLENTATYSCIVFQQKIQMQLKQQGQISNNRNLINSNFIPDYENSTSTKTLKQLQSNPVKSPPTSPRTISPLTQMMQIKNIKNDEFLFRMKLKFIACMQQLEITKEDIENLRKQQSDSDVLSSFITPIKKEFAGLKKLKEEYLVKQSKNISQMKSIKNVQSLEIISLQSQLQQISECQKKLKHRCQRLFTENAELVEKLKRKQQEFEQSQNSLYETKLLLKQYESVIQNLKLSAKKVEKDFLSEKDRLNEQLNAFKELMVRQRQAKQIYLSKLDNLQTTLLQKQDVIKRLTDEVELLKKQCIKWKNRSQWRQNETSQETRQNDKRLKSLQQEIQKLTDTIKTKDSQIILAKKQTSNSTEVFNKKLQKIVEEWKAKLIDTIEEYEGTVESYDAKLRHLEKQLQRMNGLEKQIEHITVQKGQILRESSALKMAANEKDHKVTVLQGQLKETQAFYVQKVRELESIIAQLKSQNISKNISIDQSISSLSDLGLQVKQRQAENEKLRNQLVIKENELRKINEAKKDTQNQLLKRISLAQNNRIIEVSKLKVQYEEKFNTMQKQLKRVRSELGNFQSGQIRITPKREPHSAKQSLEGIDCNQFMQQQSQLKSSNPSVNNSLNMGLSNDRANDRTNRLISETYVQPQKKSSVRRIFVRSNSINDYLKQKMASEQLKDKTSGNVMGEQFSINRESDIRVISKGSGEHQQ